MDYAVGESGGGGMLQPMMVTAETLAAQIRAARKEQTRGKVLSSSSSKHFEYIQRNMDLPGQGGVIRPCVHELELQWG